ncbi:MAG: hypothetical protein P1P65_10040 [Treponema sp.]
MKKLVFVGLFAVLASTVCFAAKGTAGGNGNGGADKIGAYVGWPFGLSYSHEFNDLVEIDLLAGYGGGLFYGHSLNAQVAALFTVFDPVLAGVGNQKCPLSLGPALGFSVDFGLPLSWNLFTGERKTYTGGSVSILLPVRWEMNFANVPDFNLFFELAPVGLSLNIRKKYELDATAADGYKIKTYVHPWYAYRAGIGLRYRIPSAKK